MDPFNNEDNQDVDPITFFGGKYNLENFLSAMVPKKVEKKIQKHGFKEYRILYFFKECNKGFVCLLNLANLNPSKKRGDVKKLSLKYINQSKLLISFVYQDVLIEDVLILSKSIKQKTYFQGYTLDENLVLNLNFIK